MIVYKVTRAEYGLDGYVEKSVPALLSAIESEMDGNEVGDTVTITIGEMTEEEYAALPEFQGW